MGHDSCLKFHKIILPKTLLGCIIYAVPWCLPKMLYTIFKKISKDLERTLKLRVCESLNMHGIRCSHPCPWTKFFVHDMVILNQKISFSCLIWRSASDCQWPLVQFISRLSRVRCVQKNFVFLFRILVSLFSGFWKQKKLFVW